MKILTLVFWCLLFLSCGNNQLNSSAVSAQENESSNQLFRILKGGKFGFINKEGNIVIEPKFEEAQNFSEGFALVSLNGKKIFIDKTGKTKIEPKNFDPINGFSDGLARGNITNRSRSNKGYLNKSGEIVIDKTDVWGACMFSEGIACVQAGKWGFIDTSGKYVIKPQFDEVSPFSEGLAAVTVWDQSKESRHKQGFIDKTGKIVIKPQYDVTQSFSEGLAAVGFKKGDDYQFGFIDKSGNMLIKPRFDWTYYFKEGLASVRISDKWGFIDKTGNLVIESVFEKAESFSEGVAAVSQNGKWGFIDKSGRFIIEPKFSEVQSFNGGLALVSYDAQSFNDVIGHFDTEGKWGYIEKSGKFIYQPTN